MSYYYGSRSPQLLPSSQYDYSPLANQAYPSSAGSSGQSNSYMYNTPSSSSTYYNRISTQTSHSPTLNLSVLNQQQQSNPYPTPRNSSNYSPNFSASSTSSYYSTSPRLRFFISKGFDVEDDLEFCPEIDSSATPHKFNPYTSMSFSPQTSPNSATIPISPSTNKSINSPKIHTPRIKKPLEIVNPLTGMRVSSPALK